MRIRGAVVAGVALAFVASGLASADASEKRYEDFDAGKFESPTRIDNPWYPMAPGTRFTWEGSSVEFGIKKDHRVIFTVTDLTMVIAGVPTRVVWDQDFVDGELEETEIAFFAQDVDGALWSLGEYPEEYIDGIFIDAPFWIHDIADGKAGILIPANPKVGTPSFSQGWSPSRGFTDRGMVNALNQKTTVPYGSFDDVLIIEEWDAEEPNARAYKHYARGVGHVKVHSEGAKDQELLELVSIEKLAGEELEKARNAALKLDDGARELYPDLYGVTERPRKGEPPPKRTAQLARPAPPAKQDPAPVAGGAQMPGTEEFGLTPRQLVQYVEAAESEIARCMREQGFDYIAVDYRTVRTGMNADKILPGLTEREFIAKFGYGISTLYTGMPPQLATGYSPAKIGLGRRNIEIYKALSQADRVAYDRALFGENSGASLSVALESENLWRTGGCTRRAIEKVFKPEQLQTTYVNPKDIIIYKDPRMKTAIRKYAAAMREEGFDFNHPDEVEAEVLKRLDAITGGRSVPLEALSPEEQAALEELKDYERRVAVASYRLEVELFEPIEELVEMELFGRDPMP